MIAQAFGSIQEFIIIAFIIGIVCMTVGIKGVGKLLVSLAALSVLVSFLFGWAASHPVIFVLVLVCALLGLAAVAFRRTGKGG